MSSAAFSVSGGQAGKSRNGIPLPVCIDFSTKKEQQTAARKHLRENIFRTPFSTTFYLPWDGRSESTVTKVSHSATVVRASLLLLPLPLPRRRLLLHAHGEKTRPTYTVVGVTKQHTYHYHFYRETMPSLNNVSPCTGRTFCTLARTSGMATAALALWLDRP